MRALIAVGALLAGNLACSRANELSLPDAGRDVVAPQPSAATVPAAVDAAEAPLSDARPTAGEAERGVVADLEADPLLLPHVAALRAHFGADAKGPYRTQHVLLAGGRAAALVAMGDESKPIVIVSERGQLVWSKPRPTAGMVPPVRSLTLAARPGGGAVLFSFVPSVNVLAARVWSEEGAAFAELEVLSVDACDAISAAYWPGKGWLVVAARRGGARAQLLREDGTSAWGRSGLDVGASWRAPAPVTIVFDTPSSAMLVQHATGAGATDHVFVFRHDARGRALWTAPLDLGEVPRVPAPSERIRASALPGDGARVELPRGVLPSRARVAEIDTSGGARLLP